MSTPRVIVPRSLAYGGPVRGAGDAFTVGERIAFYRRRRGLTQAVLAGLVGRSEDWLSKVERGERDVRRLDVVAEVARALRVTIGDLLGQPVLVEDDSQRGDNVPAVRDALMAPRRLSRVLFPRAAEAAPDPTRAAQAVESAWHDFQDGQVSRVLQALPHLQELEDASTERDRRGWKVSARIHHLAASTLSKIGEADLGWIAAERAMYAADHSDDPLVLASAARSGTHALLSVGRFDEAMQLGHTAAVWLEPQVRDGDAEALSLLGMLYLRSATASARHQNRADTREFLARASQAAERLGGDANHWQTGFGPTNVRVHEMAAALDLGDVETVVAQGPTIDVATLPPERAATHQVDVARAMSYVARDDEAMDLLLDAERRAPQLVRHSATVRETVRTMHRRAPTTATRAKPLRELAERCRAVQ